MTRVIPLALVGTSLFVVSVVVWPVLASEHWRDWSTYLLAGRRLDADFPLYVVSGQVLFVYPPPMAWLWSGGMDEQTWWALKLLALGTVLLLRPRLLMAVTVLLVLPSPAVMHDLVLGNVMVFYLVAILWSLFGARWFRSIPLGIVLAVALKPAIGPYLLWLLLRRPRTFVEVGVVAVMASAVGLLAVGADRYWEYLLAIPSLVQFAGSWPGNLGLAASLPGLALPAVAAAYVVAGSAALRFTSEPERGAAIALAAGLIAQPSVGLPYGVLLAAALVCVWRVDRRAALFGAVVSPILALGALPLAGVVVAGLALVGARALRPAPVLIPAPVPP
jgi:hypothetical protein